MSITPTTIVEIFKVAPFTTQPFRWRLKAMNNSILAESAKAYASYKAVRAAVDKMLRRFDGRVVVKVKRGVRKT